MMKSKRPLYLGGTIPIVFFGYFNPVFSYGEKDFAKDARGAGIDGLIIPDLPPEEETEFQKECRKQKLHVVLQTAPENPAADYLLGLVHEAQYRREAGQERPWGSYQTIPQQPIYR